MKRFAKKIGKILLVIIGIWAIFIAINFGYRKVKQLSLLNSLAEGFSLYVEDEHREELENTPSDISGWSKWDKYKAGLSIANGSDTDGDGLSDKEEIEVYGSDPLKVSTSGDLYSDLYKVQNNMDISVKYEYEQEMIFPYNECAEISLLAESPVDFNAVVLNHSGANRVNGAKPLAQYEVYNYSGIVTIDYSKIASEIDISKVDIFVSDGSTLKKYSTKVDGNKISLKKNFDYDKTYEIFLMERNSSNSTAIAFGGTTKISDTSSEDITGAGLVWDSPLATFILGKPIEIYYEELANEENSNVLKKNIMDHAANYIGESDSYFSEDSTHLSNKIEIGVRYEMLKNFVPFFDVTEVDSNSVSWLNYIFLYYSYEDKLAYENRPDTSSTSGFNFLEDEFIFPNFVSEYGTTGNCAGISHLTAYLYNKKEFPTQGSYSNGETNINWNISNDPDNATLMDRGLADFKTESFVKDHSSKGKKLDTDLTVGEQEFVKMISALYLEGNENANFIYSELYGGENGNVEYDYALIESMKRFLESGKILDVYLMMVDGTGHAVNVYGYKQDPDNDNVIWFDVYDSNFPQNNTGDIKESEDGIKIRVEKKVKQNGSGYTFSYDYFPVDNKSYGATSNKSISNNGFMIVMDENWRPLND